MSGSFYIKPNVGIPPMYIYIYTIIINNQPLLGMVLMLLHYGAYHCGICGGVFAKQLKPLFHPPWWKAPCVPQHPSLVRTRRSDAFEHGLDQWSVTVSTKIGPPGGHRKYQESTGIKCQQYINILSIIWCIYIYTYIWFIMSPGWYMHWACFHATPPPKKKNVLFGGVCLSLRNYLTQVIYARRNWRTHSMKGASGLCCCKYKHTHHQFNSI